MNYVNRLFVSLCARRPQFPVDQISYDDDDEITREKKQDSILVSCVIIAGAFREVEDTAEIIFVRSLSYVVHGLLQETAKKKNLNTSL